jgi:hypothetical protein
MKLVLISLVVSLTSTAVTPEALQNALQSLGHRPTRYFKHPPPTPNPQPAGKGTPCNQIVVVGKPPLWLKGYLRGLQTPVVVSNNRATVINGQLSGQSSEQPSGQPGEQSSGQTIGQSQSNLQPQSNVQPQQISPSPAPTSNLSNSRPRVPRLPPSPPPNPNYNANRNTGRPSHVPPPPSLAPKANAQPPLRPPLAPRGIPGLM